MTGILFALSLEKARYHCVRDTMEIQIPRKEDIDTMFTELRLKAWSHAEGNDSLTIR